MAKLSLIVDSLSNAVDLYGEDAQVTLTLEAEGFGVEVLDIDFNEETDLVVMTVSDTDEVPKWMKAISPELSDAEISHHIAEARAYEKQVTAQV